jgi:hypothetical protein
MGTSSEPRRFTLTDAIMLVAATAIGLALWRHNLELMWWSKSAYWPPSLRPPSLRWFWYNATRAINLLAPWSITLLALSLRRPRPPGLASRPSAIVGIVVSAGLTMWGLLFLFAVCVVGDSPWLSLAAAWFRIGLTLPGEVALSLVSVWLVGGIRSDERRLDWLDRMGWVLGGCWVVLGLLSLLLQLLVVSQER